jgi:CheY-like chemotaxis protein
MTPPDSISATPDAKPALLLIDDDPISREVMAMLLEMEGFVVQAAEDGHEALTMLASFRPEVILMDTQMPGLSGLDLIAELRRLSSARIFAISGSEPGEAIRQATDGFLLKPVQPEDLIALFSSAGPQSASATGPVPLPAPEPSASAPAFLDPAVLSKLKAMMSAKAVREIYAAVASDLTSRLPRLEAAMEAGDGDEVRRIGHAIKGGCAMVGLTTAMKTAERLESSYVSTIWSTELKALRATLDTLEGMLGKDFPA